VVPQTIILPAYFQLIDFCYTFSNTWLEG